MDATNSVSDFEFKSCLFLTIKFLESFEYEFSMYQNLESFEYGISISQNLSFIYLIHSTLLIWQLYRGKTLNENFKAITDVGWGAKHTQYQKIKFEWLKGWYKNFWVTEREEAGVEISLTLDLATQKKI